MWLQVRIFGTTNDINMKVFLIIFLISILGMNSYAQTQDDAKTLYQEAESLYTFAYHVFDREAHNNDQSFNSKRHDYFNMMKERQADQKLAKAISVVGRNPKTLYLLIKLRYLENLEKKWLASKADDEAILATIAEFFGKVDKKTYPEDKYTEMVATKSEIEAHLQLPQIKSQLKFASKEQAINYITAALSDTKNYNPEKREANDSPVTSMAAKWDGNNLINVFGYEADIDPKYCRYFAAVIDISELQKVDTADFSKELPDDNFEYQYRSHGYQFPKNAANSKLVAAGQTGDYKSPKYKKEIQSLPDIMAKVDRKFIETRGGGNFDIFLTLLLPDHTFDTVDKNINFLEFGMSSNSRGPFYTDGSDFRVNVEVNYLNAWDYLYQHGSK